MYSTNPEGTFTHIAMPPLVEQSTAALAPLNPQPEQQHAMRAASPATVEEYEWQLRAACRGMDASNFYSPEGERGPARAERERAAKAICRACPVLSECQSFALVHAEPYGIWGGMTEDERASVLVRKRARQV